MTAIRASMNPSSFRDNIQGFMASNKPPKLTHDELDRLDFHPDGISVVKEALQLRPIAHADYRELSRAATHLALQRMQVLPMITDLAVARTEYLEGKKMQVQRVRKFYDDQLLSVTKGYEAFIMCRNIHLWFWSDTDKEAFYSLGASTGLPVSIIHVFVADVLSEVEALGELVPDLKAEYAMGLHHIGSVLSAMKNAALGVKTIHFT